MSDVLKDVNQIWNRLFDHRAFLNGEIQFTLREFEQKRNDKEIENIFSLLEHVTELKSTHIDKLSQSIQTVLPSVFNNISNILHLSNCINDLELKYKEDTTIQTLQEDNNVEWQKFIENIANSCNQIDKIFKEKEDELKNFYTDLEKKLGLNNSMQS